MRRGMARSIIKQWKLNQSLHQQYGGRIIFQQAGPEPLDAYQRFHEDFRKSRAFTIHDKELEDEFWSYFTDVSIHSFFELGSDIEAGAFAAPPWVQAGSDSPGEKFAPVFNSRVMIRPGRGNRRCRPSVCNGRLIPADCAGSRTMPAPGWGRRTSGARFDPVRAVNRPAEASGKELTAADQAVPHPDAGG